MSNSQNSFSFIHCADLHLDSPFEGIHEVDPQVARVLRDSTFKSFERIVSLAIEHEVDFIVIAGDVYDSADHSLHAQIRFRDYLKRASDTGIQCFLIHGNHDPLNSWDAKLNLPPNCHRFGGDSVTKTTATRNGDSLADIYGISFPTRDVNENVAVQFTRDGEAPFAIGVLHCNLGGNPNHDNYAPCNFDDLQRANMDYWALGHVHTRNVVNAQNPCVVYPGNIQGRSVRETGERGCYLVRVGHNPAIDLEFLPTDDVRWFGPDDASLDVENIDSFDLLLTELGELRERLRSKADGRASIARIRLVGRSELHTQLLSLEVERDLLGSLREDECDRPDSVWTESIKIATQPVIDVEQRRTVDDFVGDFLRAAHELRSHENHDALREMLLGRSESPKVTSAIDEFSDDELLEILNEAELLGLDHLLQEEE